MPIGAASARPIAVTMRLPMIGLSRPPLTPGGAVILVNTSSDKPPTPFQISAPRISASQTRPKPVAA